MNDYTGISYPFRINSTGGVCMSTTNINDPKHIEESIEQILKTRFLERVMEGGEIYSTVSSFLFEPNNNTLKHLLKTRLVNDLERLESRISVDENDVDFFVEVGDNGEDTVYVTITYSIIKYNKIYNTKINIGGLNNE